MCGIYKITNLINHKIYIGQSTNIQSRLSAHKSRAFNPDANDYNSPLHSAIRKYGLNAFDFEILEECDTTIIDERERFWIEEYKSISPNGYNILIGGQQYRTEAHYCLQCGKINTSGSVSGLCLSCVQRKVPLVSKEQLLSLLTQYQGNFTVIGRLYGITDNAVRKWCKNYEIPYHSSDYKPPKEEKVYKKKVAQIDLTIDKIIAVFDSINDAARSLGKKKGSHITEVCQGKGKTAYGYKWKYLEE